MYRRSSSSYASVAAGTASAGAANLTSAPRSSTARQPPNLGSRDSTPLFDPQTPPILGPDMAMSKSRNESNDTQPSLITTGRSDRFAADLLPFFVPDYLAHSRHMDVLREEQEKRTAMVEEYLDWKKQAQSHTGLGTRSTSSSTYDLHKMPSATTTTSLSTSPATVRPPTLELLLKATDSAGPLPSKWSEADKCSGLEIFNGGLEVRFQGVTKGSDDAAAVRSDQPMPKQCGIYYFEVTVLSRGKEGLIGIGFSGTKTSLNRLPGWESESWAYHGDDGFSFACTASGKPYGPKFSAQDIIGCGVNFRKGSAFFTKNGIYLGEAFHGIKAEKLYPSVGMKKPGEHLQVNFGRTPFVFDIVSLMEKEKAVVQAEINKTDLTSMVSDIMEPPTSPDLLIQNIVSQYLAHESYVETLRDYQADVTSQLNTLAPAIGAQSPPEFPEDIHAINRQKIRRAILDGDIDKALKYLGAYYPHVFDKEENKDTYFKLRCRKFIEMMRRCTELSAAPSSPLSFSKLREGKQTASSVGRSEGDDGVPLGRLDSDGLDHHMELDGHGDPQSTSAEDADNDDDGMTDSTDSQKWTMMRHSELLNAAIAYGSGLQVEFSSDTRPEVKKALNDTFALIAYVDARDSVLGELMEGKGRVEIAEEVNGAILVSLGKPRSATLELLCAQTEVLADMLAEEGGSGAFVNLQRDYLQGEGDSVP